MPCPSFNKRARISNSSVSPGAPGVLWPPVTQPYACLHIAYCGLRSPLRAVFGHRGPFRDMEEVVLPRAPFLGGVDIQVGGAELWRIAGTGYLSGTPKKASEDWPSEWFYIEDVPLPDPVWIGLPEFDNAPLKKRPSWRPRSPQKENDREILYLMSRIRLLAHFGLTMIEVMATCIMRGVQPLQYRGHPMWDFNGEDDATRYGRKGPASAATLVKTLSSLYKGEEEEFLRVNPRGGFSMYNPPSWVSEHFHLPIHFHIPIVKYLV